MNSIYSFLLYDARFNTSKEWNTHLNTIFFFSLFETIFLYFERFEGLYFLYKIYSHILFILIVLFTNF